MEDQALRIQTDFVERNNGVRVSILRREKIMSYREVIESWQSDGDFRMFFTSVLADSVFPAYRWETPPVVDYNCEQPFEFVLLKSIALEQPADASAFSAHFASEHDIVVFKNLRGDATLIVPCPITVHTAYNHLAAFVRSAPSEQVDHLWRVVGRQMEHCLGSTPLWLSTAGLGVSWLHVRLDSRPKYYGYQPYTSPP